MAPNNLTDAPQWAVEFMKQVPTTWDEVKFIDGYPGRYVILARRHADKWYVAAVNAQAETLKVKVKLPMLAPDREVSLYSDDKNLEGGVKTVRINKKQEVQLVIPNNGGAVIMEN